MIICLIPCNQAEAANAHFVPCTEVSAIYSE